MSDIFSDAEAYSPYLGEGSAFWGVVAEGFEVSKDGFWSWIGQQNSTRFLGFFEGLRMGRGKSKDEVCGFDHEVFPRPTRWPDDNSDLCGDRHQLLCCPHSMGLLILCAGVNVVRHQVQQVCCDGPLKVNFSRDCDDFQPIIKTIDTACKGHQKWDAHSAKIGIMGRSGNSEHPNNQQALKDLGLSPTEFLAFPLKVLQDGGIKPCQRVNAEQLLRVKNIIEPDLRSILLARVEYWQSTNVAADSPVAGA